jgi:hypothetical protein
MGSYTELVLKARVKSIIPDNVEAILNFMFNDAGEPAPETWPDHQFFKCDRWQALGRSNSYYHVPWTNSRYADGYIFSRSDLKNYDDEISHFINWLTQYLDDEPGNCIGWSWYENEHQPTLLVL